MGVLRTIGRIVFFCLYLGIFVSPPSTQNVIDLCPSCNHESWWQLLSQTVAESPVSKPIAPVSWVVEDFLNALPPRWLPLTTVAALGALHHCLLVTIRHPPPLVHLWILSHLLHIARIVVSHILERREQDVRLRIMENRVCNASH